MRFRPEDPDTFDMDLKLLTQKFDFNNSLSPLQIGYATLSGDQLTIPALTTQRIYTATNATIDAVVLQTFLQEQKLVEDHHTMRSMRSFWVQMSTLLSMALMVTPLKIPTLLSLTLM